MSDMEITKALCLSTAHIKPETAEWLDQERSALPLTVWKSEYGYFIPVMVGMEPDERNAFEAKLPSDLVRCMRYAIIHECAFVRLDNDGPEVEGIDQYDWPIGGYNG